VERIVVGLDDDARPFQCHHSPCARFSRNIAIMTRAVRELGEDKLLAQVLPKLNRNSRVMIGAGDDCAVVKFQGAKDWLLRVMWPEQASAASPPAQSSLPAT
jgi:hypothetical protein